LMLSYPVLEQVINKLNLDMDSDTLAKMITLENPTDTRILNINVVSTEGVGTEFIFSLSRSG